MKDYVVFVHCDEIKAGSARVAINRYLKAHPEVATSQVKAVNKISIKTIKSPETTEVPEEGVTITDTPKSEVK